MNIELTSGKDVTVPEMLSDRIEMKLGKIEARLGQKITFRVRFEKEGVNQLSCHVHFSSSRQDFDAKATEDEIVKAADQALSKIERQVRKLQDKQSSRGSETIRETVDVEEPVESDL